MISRQNRFQGHGSLNFTYRKGSAVRSEFLSLRFVPARQEDYRLAVVVSKKVSKSAVKRNRIRRRIYEIIRTERKQAGKAWPYDMILSAFDERLMVMPAEELRGLVVGLLKKAKITA